MKIKILIFAAILVLWSPVYAQVKRESYEKAVDYLNCETVKLSLKISADSKDNEGNINPENKKNYDKYLNDFPCNEIISSENINAFLKDIKYRATTNLSEEIESLKKSSFKENWKIEDAVNFLSGGVFEDTNYPKLRKFANEKKDNPDFSTFIENLKKELPNRLSSSIQMLTPEPSVSPTPGITQPQDSSNFTLWLSIINFLLLIIGLVALFLYLKRRFEKGLNDERTNMFNHVDRKIKDERTNMENQVGRKIKETQKSGKTTTYSNLNDLKNEIDELKEKVELLVAKDRENKKSDAVNREWQQPQFNPSQSLEIFYLANPNEDGSFNVSSASTQYKPGASIYKFTKTRYGFAEFQIDEREESIKGALEFPSKNIEPVCDAQNSCDSRTSQIITLNLGRAELDGDRWKVTKNAVIRYEH